MRTIVITEKAEMEAIIHQCAICFVGLTEKDGAPYVFPMNFGYINGEIILHSAPFGTHINSLIFSNKICITFCNEGKLVHQHKNVACSYRMDSKSVICKGEVDFIEGMEEKELILNEFMKKYTDNTFKYSIPALKNVKIWRVKVIEMTAKAFGQPHEKKLYP